MISMLHKRRYALVFTFLLVAALAGAQQSSKGIIVQRFAYKIGSSRITLKKTTFPPHSRYFIVLLHDNENTAEHAATAFLKQHGGTLLAIDNKDKRLIRFTAGSRSYLFDPNRIFTSVGIRQNLSLFRSYTPGNAKAVAGFRAFLLSLVPSSALLIAVHNNTEGLYSIHSYKNPRALLHQAALTHINPRQDKDHFFVTTGYGVFKKLKQAGYNAVLQRRHSAADDGSLSYYCSRKGRAYVNVETQFGSFTTQLRMLEALKRIVK
jgi:hypothetical protein